MYLDFVVPKNPIFPMEPFVKYVSPEIVLPLPSNVPQNSIIGNQRLYVLNSTNFSLTEMFVVSFPQAQLSRFVPLVPLTMAANPYSSLAVPIS